MKNLNKKVCTDHYFYSIPANVIDALTDAAELYSYTLLLKGSIITETAIHDDVVKSYEGIEGLIECLTGWKETFDGNFEDLKSNIKRDESENNLMEWYKERIDVLDNFILTLL